MPFSRKILTPAILLVLMLTGHTAPPAWWLDKIPPVINQAVPLDANNKGPANIGQAKHMAMTALDTLHVVLPSVAALIEADLTEPRANPQDPANPFPPILMPVPAQPDAAWYQAQRAPLLIGQLKAIAHPFYNRLNQASSVWVLEQIQRNHDDPQNPGDNAIPGTHYWQVSGNSNYQENGYFPWNPATPVENNKVMANIGQLKAIFSLRFTHDTDADGMPDLWELHYGLNPNDPDDAHGDLDGDGISNVGEYLLGTSPTDPTDVAEDTDQDGIPDYAELIAGTNPHVKDNPDVKLTVTVGY